MLERVKRALTSPDHYKIIRTGKGVRNEDRAVVEDRVEPPAPDPEMWKVENSHRQAGPYRCQAVRDHGFAEVAWSVTIGDPQEAREIDELKRELEALRDDLAGDRPDVMETLPAATLQAVLAGQLSVQEARSIAELHRSFEGDTDRSGLADSVDDPTDVGEISGRAVLNILDDPSRLEELTEVAGRSLGRAAVGAAQGANEQPQPPQQPQRPSAQSRPQPEAAGGLDLGGDSAEPAQEAEAATDGGEPDEDVSPAKEAFEAARAEERGEEVEVESEAARAAREYDDDADDEGGDGDGD